MRSASVTASVCMLSLMPMLMGITVDGLKRYDQALAIRRIP